MSPLILFSVSFSPLVDPFQDEKTRVFLLTISEKEEERKQHSFIPYSFTDLLSRTSSTLTFCALATWDLTTTFMAYVLKGGFASLVRYTCNESMINHEDKQRE